MSTNQFVGNTKWLKAITLVLVIAIGTYLFGYSYSSNSEAFDEASAFISQSPIVRDNLGDVKSVGLTPFGYELEFAGSSGTASFTCNVKGSLNNGVVDINLKKSAGIWKVKGAILRKEGHQVSLQQ